MHLQLSPIFCLGFPRGGGGVYGRESAVGILLLDLTGNRLDISWKTDKNFTEKGGSNQTVWSAPYLQNYLLFIIVCSTTFWEDVEKDIKVNGDKLGEGDGGSQWDCPLTVKTRKN